MNFSTIKTEDQEFGNNWTTLLVFSDGSADNRRGERPTQFDGVHALVHEFDDEFHLLTEDDGYFKTDVILTENEVRKIHKSLEKFIQKFEFKSDYKVTFDTHIVLDRKINDEISLTVVPRDDTAPLIDMSIKGKKVQFDVNWMSSLIRVLDIDKPIK
jgi:hypothetical protein